MPHVESSTIINAPRDRVLAIARDVELFPEYMADLHSLKVNERSEDGLRTTTAWVGIVPKFGVKVRWTEEDTWNLADGTCRFHQIEGDYDQFEGIWTFTALEDGRTRFDSVLDYRLEIPLVGAVIKSILQKTVQNNLDSTLRAIKERSESAA